MSVTRSAAYVRDAQASLPGELARCLALPLPGLAEPPAQVVTTGIGASEGPARLLAALLVEAGICARFCVTSLISAARRPIELLVVFSQGLSPNARLALSGAAAARHCWLVTSVEPAHASAAQAACLAASVAEGVVPIVLPPARESGTLVRFVGPTVAALAAFRIAAHLARDAAQAAELAGAPLAYAPLPLRARLDAAPMGLIAAGIHPDWMYAHRWKLLETLLAEDPPVWEALQFAHGPLQASYERPLCLLAFESGGPSPLVDRLARTLHPERHRLLRLTSARSAPLSFFEHTATLDALLLEAIEARGLDLFDWPARAGDAPLYDLGPDDRARSS